jgi:hypothetical protein
MSPRFACTASLLLAVLLVASAPFRVAAADAEAVDVAGVSSKIGRDPLYCAAVPGREICTWHEKRRARHVVCDFDEAGVRTDRSCLVKSDNEEMLSFPSRGRGRVGKAQKIRRELRSAAEAKLEGLRTLDDVIELAGAGPAWCRVGEEVTCVWKAVRRTPGYILLSRVANVQGKKLDVMCRFDGSGEILLEVCRVELKGSFPPPPE